MENGLLAWIGTSMAPAELAVRVRRSSSQLAGHAAVVTTPAEMVTAVTGVALSRQIVYTPGGRSG